MAATRKLVERWWSLLSLYHTKTHAHTHAPAGRVGDLKGQRGGAADDADAADLQLHLRRAPRSSTLGVTPPSSVAGGRRPPHRTLPARPRMRQLCPRTSDWEHDSMGLSGTVMNPSTSTMDSRVIWLAYLTMHLLTVV